MTPGAVDQLLARIGRTLRREHLGGHAVRELAKLSHERSPLLEQPPVEAAIAEEPDEGAHLAQESPEPLAPDQRQQTGRYDQKHEQKQRAASDEAPDEPS